MAKTKTEQLNELFSDWEKCRKCNSENDNQNLYRFCRDGIIDENIFEKQKTKVLFISNEANLGKDYMYYYETGDEYDRRKHFLDYYNQRHDEWQGKLRERVSALYQVVINDFSLEPYEVANRFAFMNLNKRGGVNRIVLKDLIEYCQAYRNEIAKEIEIISPDLIIWLSYSSYNAGIPEIITNNEDINLKNIPIIRMWHTSYIYGRVEHLIGQFGDTNIDKLASKLTEELNENNLL